MSAPKNEFLNKVRVLLLGVPLLLTACHSDFGPYPMPTGYHYHDEIYKTPPGPEPVFKKIEHMRVPQSVDNAECPPPVPAAPTMCPASVTAPPPAPGLAPVGVVESMPVAPAFEQAATDLVRRIVDQFGLPAEPVFVTPASSNVAGEMKLEKALRNALMEEGFKIAPAPGIGPFTLEYGITGGASGRSLVKISIMGQESVVAEQSGLYDLGIVVANVPPPEVPQSFATPAPRASQGAPMPIGPE